MPRLITVKDAVNRASLEIGIIQTSISGAVGNPDQDISQMLALLAAVADEVLLEEPYKQDLGDGYWIADGNTLQPKEAITADTDVILFDGRLCISGLKMQFLQAKGLEFGEQSRAFATRLNKLAGRVNGRVLDLDEDLGRVI